MARRAERRYGPHAGRAANVRTAVSRTAAVAVAALAFLVGTKAVEHVMAPVEEPSAGAVAKGTAATGAGGASEARGGRSAVVVAAGDIACRPGGRPTPNQCQQRATSDLALAQRPDAVLPLGDNVYETGELSEFLGSYRDTWGRMDSIAHPVPGNHEYGYLDDSARPSGGEGYLDYFKARAHPLDPNCTRQCTTWYSWDLGSWHMIALDSQCMVVGGCDPGTPQYEWLALDLAQHPRQCTLAYWHIPLFSSSDDHSPAMRSVFELLQHKGVDLVLNGHGHFYERFAAQGADGRADAKSGIPQIIVGTGGRSFFPLNHQPAANSLVRIADTFGVLRLTLAPGGFSVRYLPATDGAAADAGQGTCR